MTVLNQHHVRPIYCEGTKSVAVVHKSSLFAVSLVMSKIFMYCVLIAVEVELPPFRAFLLPSVLVRLCNHHLLKYSLIRE